MISFSNRPQDCFRLIQAREKVIYDPFLPLPPLPSAVGACFSPTPLSAPSVRSARSEKTHYKDYIIPLPPPPLPLLLLLVYSPDKQWPCIYEVLHQPSSTSRNRLCSHRQGLTHVSENSTVTETPNAGDNQCTGRKWRRDGPRSPSHRRSAMQEACSRNSDMACLALTMPL